MIQYRTFRNNDPPKILAVWNACLGLRGFGRPRGCDSLEQFLFSKPYFDRQGLWIAESGGQVIGFAHAGFAASDDKSSLDPTLGAVYMVQVLPPFRRRGIGRELVRLCQAYLVSRGAEVQYLGGMFPLNAFYLGLFGGSELPGLLESDPTAIAFARSLKYEPCDTCLVYHRRLDELPRTADPRIPLLKREVEVQAEPMPALDSWWEACVLGNAPALRYEMIEKETRALIGRALVWEMETFGLAWQASTVGINDFHIEPHFRRKGFAKLLLLTILRHLREQQIELVELQTMERNQPARQLYEGVGFECVDRGFAFRRNEPMDQNLPTLPPLPVASKVRGPRRFKRSAPSGGGSNR